MHDENKAIKIKDQLLSSDLLLIVMRAGYGKNKLGR